MITVVADLHLGAGGRTEEFEDDDALAARLLTARDGERLVLLGDVVDFARIELGGPRPDAGRLDMRAPAALRKLDLAVAAHPRVFAALRTVAEAGVRIDLLPGNHDLEWGHAAVRARLEEHLGAPVAFHPWVLHLPGVMFAEHGSQHHDLNRLPDWLGAVADPARAPVPAGTLLEERSLARGAAGLLRLARPRARTAAGHAAEAGIPAAALAAIDAAPRGGPARAVWRRLTRQGDYMQAAAQRIDTALRAAGAEVPFIVLAHTHVPADVELVTGTRYLNPGPWARLRPAGRGATAVRIDGKGARVVS